MFSTVISRACIDSRSFSASLVNSTVIGWPVKREFAITRRSAPSSSRTLERMRFAMKKATSSGSSTPENCALVRRLDRHRQPPPETRLQALLETVDFLRIAVAGEDDLVLALEQLVEGVEEF